MSLLYETEEKEKDFLTNFNMIDFVISGKGIGNIIRKQTKKQFTLFTMVGDVQLPPWAENDGFVFRKKMREALESEYVRS